jgi:putative ABC transport system permease protein
MINLHRNKKEKIMLQLKDIKKSYQMASTTDHALNGVNLSFPDSEFVSILGPSGSGKTTLLNIIGGLDRYTEGDLLIDGKSTMEFSESDWDAYRNTTIGFIFQNYNLISHLTILDNVEMALRLSGISAQERRARSKKVLIDVGLADHLHKRPNQLSGGQMQRVAIARAMVNNPKILLADEPTGALDSKTSWQIIQLVKEISKDRLVIMVTHNADIAEKFSDRIVKLLDGQVIEDTRPVIPAAPEKKTRLLTKKTSMSYATALDTSFKNLLTKKGRTLITAIAGSIGIIGIALVLALSTGMTDYVNTMQSDTLAGFPVTINSTIDTDFMSQRPGIVDELTSQPQSNVEYPEGTTIYSYDSAANTTRHTNIIDEDFLAYLDDMDTSYINSITYTRAVSMNLVAETSAGGYIKVVTGTAGVNPFFGGSSIFSEMPDNPDFIDSQYELLDGVYPTTYSELLLVVDKSNRIDVSILDALGIGITEAYSFSDFLGKSFKIIPNDQFYEAADTMYIQGTDYEAMYNDVHSIEVSIAGIMRVSPDASSELLSNGLNYTTLLTDHVLSIAATSQIVMAQMASPTINVLTGTAFNNQITYQGVMRAIGGDSTPTGVQIYPVSFDSKDQIKAYLDAFNVDKDDVDKIVYTDLAETISTTIANLINTITIILAAFAGISLLVSSIMIGIITYVSVVERTKEIGIMRSLGARKKDIARIFNAETILIGFGSGLLGIGLAALLTIPVNLVIEKFIGVADFSILNIQTGVGLIVLSTLLTLIAGLFPSSIASKKDPVIALRTE